MAPPNSERAVPANAGDDPKNGCQANSPNKPTGSNAQERSRVRHRPNADRAEERYKLTRPKAEELAGRIRQHWAARGHIVRVWVEPISETSSVEWVVRSSLQLRRRP